MHRLYTLFCLATVVAAMILPGCKSEVSYKAVREEVIQAHDVLMADEDKVMNVKMKLDTLLTSLKKLKAEQPTLDTAKVHSDINALSGKLSGVSDKMSLWMQTFKTDMGSQPNAEAVAYFQQEKVKVRQLDSAYKVVLEESNGYLKQFNMKADTAKHDHSMHM